MQVDSFQTNGSVGKDFQSQTAMEPEKKKIITQTENFEKQDFQVQVNLVRETETIEVQTIKQENELHHIPMPNIPNSERLKNSKKRKLCTKPSTTSKTIGTQYSDSEAIVDESILNSEVYKIYCRYQDPNDAIRHIKKLKTCILFEEPNRAFPSEADWNRGLEHCFASLNKQSHRSKWEQHKYILNGGSDGYGSDTYFQYDIAGPEFGSSGGRIVQNDIKSIIEDCFTQIKMLHHNGVEFWFINNFKGGVGASEWYRGFSITT